MTRLISIDKSMEFAVENVIRYGDTDIFPYPIERQIFKDTREEVVQLLLAMKSNFYDYISKMPVVHEKILSSVGYTGFRQGTQIDPIWNVYLLGLICNVGEEIEKERIKKDENIVFSYRFSPDKEDYTLFDKDYGWTSFQKHSIELASTNKYVLTCDISDFYPRIYHHRLENALTIATKNTEVVRHIMYILNDLSENASYGLPVGGPSARLLSELLLTRVDKLLLSQKIKFCRFVDDYHVFGESKEQIYDNLVVLSDLLITNEGLTLQKTKTRVLSSAEFIETSAFADVFETDDESDANKRRFIKIHMHYDPYSDTAEEDYQALCDEINKFDIIGMLTSEMQKTRISEGVTKKLIKAIALLENNVKEQAILSLLENLNVLYPIIPTVMLLMMNIIDEISEETKTKLFDKIRALIETKSYIFLVPVNLLFAIRLLSYDSSDETEMLLIDLFSEKSIMMAKRDIILILAQRNAHYWLSNQMKHYNMSTPWEKRSLLLASYRLEDEGTHWRDRKKKEGLTDFDELAVGWAGNRKNEGKDILL